MKKLIGNFATADDYSKFDVWRRQAKINLESYSTSIPSSPFVKGGYIIFNETTTEGKKLYDHLILKGWVEDTQYPIDIQKQKDAERARKLQEEKRIAEAKKAQDEINEKENRPNLIKSLLKMPYVDKTKTELQAMSFEDLVQYHSDYVTKQSKIHELIKIKKEKNTIQNWDKHGIKSLDQLNLEIQHEKKSLNSLNTKKELI